VVVVSGTVVLVVVVVGAAVVVVGRAVVVVGFSVVSGAVTSTWVVSAAVSPPLLQATTPPAREASRIEDRRARRDRKRGDASWGTCMMRLPLRSS
jgi:hypothetical protein